MGTRGILQDLTGKRFGMLTVICRSEQRSRYAVWECKCDCGNTTHVLSTNLRRGFTKSCGCLRTTRKFNKHYFVGDVCHIKVKDREILIDKSSLPLITDESWHISKNGYAVGNSTKRYMHRVVMGNPKDVIDHINRNRLDNRKENLRLANPSINGFNATRKLGASGHRYIMKRKDGYYVYFHSTYKGFSTDINEAIKIRDYWFDRYVGKEYGATV